MKLAQSQMSTHIAQIYTALNIELFSNPQKLKLNSQKFNRVIAGLALSDRMHWQQKYEKKYDLLSCICKYKHMLYILSTINQQAHDQEMNLIMSSEELILLKSKNQSQGGKLETSTSLIKRMRKRDGFDRVLLVLGCLLYLSICGYIIYRRTAAHIFG